MRSLSRIVVYVLAVAMIAFAGIASFIGGHVPASVPSDAPAYSLSPFSEALRAVDDRGQIDLVELKKRHESLENFVASLAATSPETKPDLFPTVEARLAYWLNAYHAAVLLELMDTRSTKSSASDELFNAVAIGGHRVTRWSMYRNTLSQSGDARVFFSIATGEKGRGVLDGAPFDADSLNLQLDDAMRRFVQRKDHVSIDGKTVKLSVLFQRHREEILAALPDERKNVLQIVWAYLPETCEADKPGCHTRADLDSACGNKFDACTTEFVEPDPTLTIRN
ncbi:MAG: DUF547 domain-containing protein [Archangium sp.]|nr:DUF547 domain-containing protein [Archangium sp.]